MRSNARPSRDDIWQMVMRSMAALLLALIVADLSNASCEPFGIREVTLDTSPSRTAAGDACGTICVPDCFYCSTLVQALPSFSLPMIESITEAPAPPVYNLRTGISPILDHIPIASL
jgi:hypothetical protein